MTRAEFLAGGEQRLNYLLQQVEREAAARRDFESTGAEIRAAQIKLASAKSEFLDFLFDAIESNNSEGLNEIIPSHLAPSTEGRTASAGSSPSGRDPKTINTDPRL